jgi:predicted TIM-barrel fold metal-dependent hydrolase
MSDTGQRVVIISADCHAGPERVSDYEDYTPEVHREALRDYVSAIDAFESERTVATGAGGRGGAVSRDDLGLWDMPTRTKRMDADGVVAEVIFPQGAVPFAPYPAVGPTRRIDWTASDEQRDSGPEIYNRWLADFCSAEPEAHYGVAVIPASNIEASVRELARARESGLRGGISLPPVREDRTYNDPRYDRLWAACQDYDMVLNIHGGAGISYSGGVEVLAINLSETDFFTRRALWFLIFSGVFERFPRLRLAITEQRAHWVPGLLAELDSIYRSARSADLRAQLPRLPSEYFANNCFVGASFMSKPECDLRHQIGVDRLMWGSDYPHAEGVWPWVREGLRWTFDGVEESEFRRLLGGNAISCYGFDPGRLGRRAEKVGPAVEAITRNPLAAPPDDPGVELSWAFRSTPWA